MTWRKEALGLLVCSGVHSILLFEFGDADYGDLAVSAHGNVFVRIFDLRPFGVWLFWREVVLFPGTRFGRRSHEVKSRGTE